MRKQVIQMNVILLVGKPKCCACADPRNRKKILVTTGTNEKTGYPDERNLTGWTADTLRMRRSADQKERYR